MRYTAKERRTLKRKLLRELHGIDAIRYEDSNGVIIGYEDPFPPEELGILSVVRCDPRNVPYKFIRDHKISGKHKRHDTSKVAQWYSARGYGVRVKRSRRTGSVEIVAAVPEVEADKKYKCTVTRDDGALCEFTVTCKGSHIAAGLARERGRIESIEKI